MTCITYTVVLWQLEFYSAFKFAHLEVQVSFTNFQLLKPWFVTQLKDWNTCTCRYHIELHKILTRFNDMRTHGKGVHFNCRCDCIGVCRHVDNFHSNVGSECETVEARYVGLSQVWKTILCPMVENSEWHAFQCLMSTCKNCGVRKLNVCPSKLNMTGLVKWRRITQVVLGKKKDG